MVPLFLSLIQCVRLEHYVALPSQVYRQGEIGKAYRFLTASAEFVTWSFLFLEIFELYE